MQPTPVQCPVRGHDHHLTVVRHHTQKGTGATARTLECPTGRYRFFRIDGSERMARFERPRWGWPK